MRTIEICFVFGEVEIPFAKADEIEMTASNLSKLNDRNAKGKNKREKMRLFFMKLGKFCIKEVFIFMFLAHGAVLGL